MRKILAALAAWSVICVASTAFAGEWSKPSIASRGSLSTWTEAADGDSGRLTVDADYASCVNTGANNFTVHDATSAGTKLGVYKGPIVASGACSDATNCGRVLLIGGDYIFDCSAGGCSAECRGN